MQNLQNQPLTRPRQFSLNINCVFRVIIMPRSRNKSKNIKNLDSRYVNIQEWLDFTCRQRDEVEWRLAAKLSWLVAYGLAVLSRFSSCFRRMSIFFPLAISVCNLKWPTDQTKTKKPEKWHTVFSHTCWLWCQQTSLREGGPKNPKRWFIVNAGPTTEDL